MFHYKARLVDLGQDDDFVKGSHLESAGVCSS